MIKGWSTFRCDCCGKFIGLNDLVAGHATRRLLTPLSEFTLEEYETLCKQHSGPTGGQSSEIAVGQEGEKRTR